MESSRKECDFDIIIFGASGFTGKYVIAEVARAFMVDPCLKFAVAGRNVQKLQESLLEVQNHHATGHQSLTRVKKIVANVDDIDSLVAMAMQARVIINCVGPYAYYGDAVVRACIKAKCSHIDISGEQIFLEAIHLKYDVEARQSGIYVIGSCGFDTIPSDLGVLYTSNEFNGDLNSVEGYFNMISPVSGVAANYGTFASAVNIFRDKSRIFHQNKKLLTKPLPLSNHPMIRRKEVFYSDDMKAWCHRFPGCDRSVVKRTQYQFYHYDRKRVVQYACYLCHQSLLRCLMIVAGFLVFSLMCSFRVTRWLMLLFPELFTLGMFSRKGPSREQINNASFTLTLYGNGYKSKIYEANIPHTERPESNIVTKVTGPDAGYITTSICAVTSALLVLQESDRLPPLGGVYTPAAAFAKTTVFDRLADRGITFKVVEMQK